MRLDHTFNNKFSLWGKFENDSIPTVEPGGLFTGAAFRGMAVTDTNAPGKIVVAHALYSFSPALIDDASFNYSEGRLIRRPRDSPISRKVRT